MLQSVVLASVESNSPSPSCDCLAHSSATRLDGPDRVRCYGSDLTDAEWQVVRPLLPVPAWFQGRGGRPESYCHRVMLDAVRYVVDNGVKWASLPADFPPCRRVHAFARRRQVTGLLAEFHDRLRDRVRDQPDGPKISNFGVALILVPLDSLTVGEVLESVERLTARGFLERAGEDSVWIDPVAIRLIDRRDLPARFRMDWNAAKASAPGPGPPAKPEPEASSL